jgi:thymidylate kinase
LHIELIGCTSAGKTTLAKKLVVDGKRQGVEVTLGDDFVLQKLYLNWIKSEFMRRRLLEILSGYIGLRHWQKYRMFFHLIFRLIMKAPGSWFYKANLARNVLRKIGIHEIIQNASAEDKMILVDNDGVVQATHNLFVHGNGRLDGDLLVFAKSAPLPDMIAYLRQPESILLERTLRRGHPRIPGRSQGKVQDFIKQAARMFENLQKIPEIANRLLIIDSKRKTVLKQHPANGQLIDEAGELIQTSLKNEEEIAHQRPSAPSGLGLINRLIESLHIQRIDYCHWKSNINLGKSFEGEADLDLFVSRESLSQLLSALTQLGFRAARIKYGLETQGVTHYYGLDAMTGKLVHVHLFTRLVTGESFVKSHHLPFEKMLLENKNRVGRLEVVSKPAELVLFTLRTFIKYGSLPDMVRLVGNSAALREELRWLLGMGNLSVALSLLHTHCPVIEEPLFLSCIDAIDKDHSLLRKVILAWRVRGRLNQCAKYNLVKRMATYYRVVLAKLRRILRGNVKDKTPQSGGAVIAFIGADGTGKSTLVSETVKWLGDKFVVRAIHTGKPSSSLLTAPANIILHLFRKLTAFSKDTGFRGQSSSNGLSPTQHRFKGLSSLPHALRSTILAWDRLRIVLKAKRLATEGEIIVCDRYPSRLIGAMDSPRLEEESQKTGPIVSLYNSLARVEKRLYEQISAPDLVLRLNVSLETAKKRNRERNVQDKEAYLAARHRQVQEWRLPGTRYVYDIDTEKPLKETICSIKKKIWESL